MAARLWWLIAAVQMALSASLAAAVIVRCHGPPVAAVPIALLLLGALQCALIGVSFGVALLGRRRSEIGTERAPVLSAWWRECLGFTLAQCRMCLEALRPMRDIGAPGAGQTARPVLLLHGVACNRAVWRSLLERLRAAGYAPVRALSLEPLFCDLDAHVAPLEHALRQLQGQCGGRRACVVTHSMGGLVARSLLRRGGTGLMQRLITIATPHHGTWYARWLPWPALRQMRPDSEWLRRLSGDPASTALPLLCLYSLEDNLVVPADSAALAGVHCEAVRGIGHLQMLHSPTVLERVVAELSLGCADER